MIKVYVVLNDAAEIGFWGDVYVPIVDSVWLDEDKAEDRARGIYGSYVQESELDSPNKLSFEEQIKQAKELVKGIEVNLDEPLDEE